jgi:hypothetical protein
LAAAHQALTSMEPLRVMAGASCPCWTATYRLHTRIKSSG